jgi:hypothetical protein
MGIDEFISFSQNYKPLAERKLESFRTRELIKEARSGNWRPDNINLSQFYESFIGITTDEEWPELRETIMRLEELEADIFNPVFHLREDQNQLCEEYLKTIMFDHTQHLTEARIGKDLANIIHAAQTKYGANFAYQFGLRDFNPYTVSTLKPQQLRQILSSIKQRAQQEGDQQMLAAVGRYERIRQLDNARKQAKRQQAAGFPQAQAAVPGTPAQAAPVAPDPVMMQQTPQQVVQNTEAQIEQMKKQGVPKQTLLQTLGSKIKKAVASGKGTAVEFLKKYKDDIIGIAKAAGYAFSAAKFSAVFAPFGPIGWCAGVLVGIGVAYVTKKFGAAAAEMGKEKLAPIIIKALQEKQAKVKNKTLKNILGAIVSPRGKAIITTLCTVVSAVAVGMITAGSFYSLAKSLVGALSAIPGISVNAAAALAEVNVDPDLKLEVDTGAEEVDAALGGGESAASVPEIQHYSHEQIAGMKAGDVLADGRTVLQGDINHSAKVLADRLADTEMPPEDVGNVVDKVMANMSDTGNPEEAAEVAYKAALDSGLPEAEAGEIGEQVEKVFEETAEAAPPIEAPNGAEGGDIAEVPNLPPTGNGTIDTGALGEKIEDIMRNGHGTKEAFRELGQLIRQVPGFKDATIHYIDGSTLITKAGDPTVYGIWDGNLLPSPNFTLGSGGTPIWTGGGAGAAANGLADAGQAAGGQNIFHKIFDRFIEKVGDDNRISFQQQPGMRLAGYVKPQGLNVGWKPTGIEVNIDPVAEGFTPVYSNLDPDSARVLTTTYYSLR